MKLTAVQACLATLLLAACSGGSPPSNGNAAAANTANSASESPRPTAETPPEDPPVRPEWLRVGCSVEGKRASFTIGGETVSRDEFMKRLTQYGARKDEGAALPGLDEQGISDNPVVLQAKWTDHGGVLFEVMECCGNANTRRLVLDLGSRRFRCDLPIATDLPPVPLPPMPDPGVPKDEDGLPDAVMGQTGKRSIRILPVFSEERGVYGYSLKEKSVETQVTETAFEIKKLLPGNSLVDKPLWEKVRAALVLSLEKLDVQGARHEVSVIVAHKGGAWDNLSWASIATVALAVDAVDHWNFQRRVQRKPQVWLTFRSIG